MVLRRTLILRSSLAMYQVAPRRSESYLPTQTIQVHRARRALTGMGMDILAREVQATGEASLKRIIWRRVLTRIRRRLALKSAAARAP